MKTITIILLAMAIWLPAKSGTFIMRTNTGLVGQTGWSYSTNNLFFSDGALYSRMNTGTSVRTGLLSVSGSPGTYRIWMRARAYDTGSGTTNMGVGLVVGDQSVALRTTNSSWTFSAPVTVGTSFTSVSMTVTNPLGALGPYDIYLNGFYFGRNTNEAFVASDNFANTDNLLCDFSLPSSTNSTDIVPGNHVPNSSFEAGLSGWSWDRDGYTNNPPWLVDVLDTNNPHSGLYSIQVGDYAARYRIHTPVFRLRGETNVWRPYTLSFWSRSTGSITPVVTTQPGVPSPAGLPNPNLQTFTMSPSVGTSWVRKSTNIWLTLTPTREIYFQIYHVATGTNSLWVDDVMLEEGHTLHNWEPMDSVEIGVSSKPKLSVFLKGEDPWFDLLAVNASTNTLWQGAEWSIYDAQNILVSSGSTNLLISPGSNTRRIYGIPSTPGPYRIVAHRKEAGSGLTSAERTYTVLGYSSWATDAPTNSLWGTHVTFWGPPTSSNILMYIPWTRTLSASGFGKWLTAEPSDGVYDWTRFDWTAAQWPTNLNILVSIGDMGIGSSPSAPAWAITNGFPKEYAVSRYMSNLVARYPQVKAWEMVNEPHYHFTAAQAAKIADLMVDGITSANSNAVFIAGGGQIYTNDFAQAWSLMSSNTKARTGTMSVHLYPETGQNSWNVAEADVYIPQWKTLLGNLGLTAWNTEMGTWGYAPLKITGAWPTGGSYSQPFDFEELAVRSHHLVAERLMRQSLRIVGNGIRNFQYDSRLSNYRFQQPGSQPTIYHFDDSLSAQGAAYSFAAYLIRTPVGQVSAPSTNIESWLYQTVDGRSVIAAWTYFRAGTNSTVTLTNSSFGLLNLFGAELQTNVAAATITRAPRYIVSNLSTSELATAWSGGSVAHVADVSPPNVQVDVSPSGVFGSSSELPKPPIFRWTAVDSNYVNTVGGDSKVVTRWRIPTISSNWSAWSNDRLLILTNAIPAGPNSIEVQSVDVASTSTNTTTGPAFSVGGQKPMGSAVVSGQTSIQTLQFK